MQYLKKKSGVTSELHHLKNNREITIVKIPFHQSDIGEAEINEVVETLKSGWLTTGPRTKKFEESFKEYIGCQYAIGLNSCTAGLHIALDVLGIKNGDEVITSPITFPATANVILHRGAVPVFVDVEKDSLTIDSDKIEEKISDKTKAILPIHFAGYPCDMDRIKEIADRNNLYIIEDAAHAIETRYKEKKIGMIGDFTSFSFYATKNITSGEGGMLVTNNREYAERARLLSNQGITRDAWNRHGNKGFRHWDLVCPGYKYNMFDIQAAIGSQQLLKIESFLEKRNKYVALYDEAFADIPEMITLKKGGDIKHAHHLYPVIIKTEELGKDRDAILEELQNHGIGVGVHFRALHLNSYYREHFAYIKGTLPIAEYISDRLLSLPLYPKMDITQIEFVIKTVKDVLKPGN